MYDELCKHCQERSVTRKIRMFDPFTHKVELFDVCDECYAEAIASYKDGGKIMSKRFSVVVSLPKGVTESNFADSVGLITEAKRKDGSVITMKKTGGGVYRFPLNLTKLRAMIEKHNLIKKDGRTNEDIVWLSLFEKDVAATGQQTQTPAAV